MQKVGVEAIVAGLGSFLGDMKKVDSSIKDLIPGSNLLSRAFEGVGSVVQWLTGSVFRVLEYTLGNLIAGAIRDIISEIKELISATIEAGSEFQSLEIRLRNFNLNTLIESGQDYATASQGAIDATKEQLTWLQKLAATTPYDLTDVANVYTLARSYSFVDDEAKKLTERITDFASGMGLGNTEIERIIVNFGQMVQQGKVTQREMNDLARGAFVPVNDILAEMERQTGLTGDEFDDFRNSTDGVNAFMNAFSALVESRFSGATEKMAQTWKGATDNVKDFIKSLFGLNVVKPVLDVLGKNISEFINAFTSGQRWESMVSATTRIGETLSKIVSHVLHLGDGAEGMADKFLGAVEGVADWLETHQGDIQKWLEDGIAWIRNVAIPKIMEFKDFLFGTDERKGAIQQFIDWLINTGVPFIQNDVIPVIRNIVYIIQSLQPTLAPLQDLFLAVAEVIATAFDGDEPESFADFVTNTLVPAIQNLTQFIREHKDTLALLLKAWIAFEIIGTIVGVATSLIVKGLIAVVSVLTVILTPLGLLQKLIMAIYTAFNWLSALLMTSVGTAFVVFVVAIVGAIAQLKVFEFSIRTIIGAVQIMAQSVVQWFTLIKANVIKTVQDAVNAIRNGDWLGAGKAIIDGMYRGIIINAHLIISTLTNLAKNALAAAKATLGIKSPSTEFFKVGEQLMKGFANGITATADLAAKAMQGATAATLSIGAMAPSRMAGAMAPGTVSNNTTNNLTLNMNTSAPSENVVADFEMMRSMAGV